MEIIQERPGDNVEQVGAPKLLMLNNKGPMSESEFSMPCMSESQSAMSRHEKARDPKGDIPSFEEAKLNKEIAQPITKDLGKFGKIQMNAKFGSEQIKRGDINGKKAQEGNMLADSGFGGGLDMGGGVFEEEDSGSHDSD